jgi:hypothetical protein
VRAFLFYFILFCVGVYLLFSFACVFFKFLQHAVHSPWNITFLRSM